MPEAAAAMARAAPLVVGRYALFDEIAAGGMATVHLGRLLGPVGFGRTVAIKRLHPHYVKDQEFITMFMDEARIVARIVHPNVVPMVDVVQNDEGLFLVMEYVHGESLSRLMRNARQAKEKIPAKIVASVMSGVLLGLHAAHETKGPDGQLLGVVHRDVSPQNIIVGSDGSPRVLDFGIAKAAGRAQITREGQIKGKLAYMAPEQIRGQVDRRTDVFAAAVVLWEMFAGRRLHEGAKDVDIVTRLIQANFPPPSQFTPGLGPEVDEIVLKGLATDPKKRYGSARELALELQRRVGMASPTEVSDWVERSAHEVLAARSDLVNAMELAAGHLVAVRSSPPVSAMALPRTLPMAIPTSRIALIPMTLDEPGGDVATSSITGNDVASSAAVFSHTQASNDSTRAGRPRISRGAWIAVALCAVLAVLGGSLGAYALHHRSEAQARAPQVDPTSSPAGAEPRPAPSAASPSSSSPSSSLPVSSSSSPAASGASSAQPDDAMIDLDDKGSGVAVAIPSSTAAPAVRLAAPLAAPRPKARPACDPPYTVDDVGHRHYKAECMGLE